MSGLVTHLLSVPAWLVLLVTGGLVLAEDALFVGFVLPAETVAILSGVAAKLGHVSLAAVLVTVILAAIVGDSIGYEVGKHFGRRLLNWHRLAAHRERLAKAENLLSTRGGMAVFLGRFVAFLRAMMPALAGMARMPYPTFLAFNAAGGIFWGTGVVLLGYAAGASYAKVEGVAGKGAAAVVAVIVLIAIIVWRVREHRKQQQEDAEPAA